jgi:hypothetical protein
VQGARCKVQGARCKVQGARCEGQGARGEGLGATGDGRGARGEGRGPRGEERGARGEGRGARCEGRGARCEGRGQTLFCFLGPQLFPQCRKLGLVEHSRARLFTKLVLIAVLDRRELLQVHVVRVDQNGGELLQPRFLKHRRERIVICRCELSVK